MDNNQLNRDNLLKLVLLVVTAFVFYACYLLVRPFFPALVWALALAVVGHPLHELIAKKVRKKNAAALVAVVLVTFVFAGPVLFASLQVSREVTTGLEKLEDEDALGDLERYLRENRLLSIVASRISVKSELRKLASTITGHVPSFLKGSAWLITEVLITCFILFYFFRDKPIVLRKLRELLPLSKRESDSIFVRVGDTIYAIIYGTVVVAAIQGTLAGLMFWALGLPSPLLWGIVMAILAVIPILGAAIVWVPTAVLLAANGQWEKALLLTAWGTIVVGLIDNLIYPILVGNRIREHTLLVFFAILGGLIWMGAAGVVLGPLLLAVTDALIHIWQQRAPKTNS